MKTATRKRSEVVEKCTEPSIVPDTHSDTQSDTHRNKHSSEGLGSHKESGPPTEREYVCSFWHMGGPARSADSLLLICLVAPSSDITVKLS